MKIPKKIRKCEPWIKLTPPDFDTEEGCEEDEIYIRGKDIAEVNLLYFKGRENPWVISIQTTYNSHYDIASFTTKDRASVALVEYLKEFGNNEYGIRIMEPKKEGEIDY